MRVPLRNPRRAQQAVFHSKRPRLAGVGRVPEVEQVERGEPVDA
jgi:hypothetical protein